MLGDVAVTDEDLLLIASVNVEHIIDLILSISSLMVS